MQRDCSAYPPKMTALPPARKRFAQPWSVAEGTANGHEGRKDEPQMDPPPREAMEGRLQIYADRGRTWSAAFPRPRDEADLAALGWNICSPAAHGATYKGT